MSKITSLISRAPKRFSAIVAMVAAAIIVPAALFAWGPSRQTFTTAQPADYITFNSIVDNPAHGDERNFVQVREASASNETYADEISLSAGKEDVIYMYYHNNAASNLNLTATGTYAKAEIPAVVPNGSTGTKAVGYVGASNAKPTQVWDDISFKNSTGGDIALRYVPGSATIHNFGATDGATLSAGTDNGDGTWTLGAEDLDGLTITPADDYSGSFDLNVTVTSTDGDDTASVSETVTVDVAGVADAPTLETANASGTEDSAIALDIDAGLTDSSETLTITISGVPEGASLSAGTDNGDGTWSLTSDDLEGLTITPPEDFSGSFDLTVTATSSDGADTASIADTLSVTVDPVADAPTLSVDPASGNEDSAIALDIDAGLTDSSETLTVTISGVPDGATLSAGTDNGDGIWTLGSDQLEGLTITPAEDFSGSFDLSITAVSADGEDVASVGDTITVDVAGVADTPTLDDSDASGSEDSAIALDIEVDELVALDDPKEETVKKKWLLLMHATPLAGLILPLLNVLIPLFLWIHKREDNPVYNEHGIKVINFHPRLRHCSIYHCRYREDVLSRTLFKTGRSAGRIAGQTSLFSLHLLRAMRGVCGDDSGLRARRCSGL